MKQLTDFFPVPFMLLPETHSTNSYLQALCEKTPTPEFTTVAAEYQTAGRGQRGNTWEAAPEKNLLFSLVLYPDFLEAQHQFYLSQIVSLAIKEELDTYLSDVSIKWPNDIYWKDKKICGILIEQDLMGKHISRSIAGVGLNINQETFLSPAPNPVSLRQITGKEFDRWSILKGILQRLTEDYDRLKRGETQAITERYATSLFRREGWHTYKDKEGIFKARILQVEPSGRLLLEDEHLQTRGYLFKEVEYVL